MTGKEPEAKKKRVADRQITKDDAPSDNEDGDDAAANNGNNGTFRKADAAVLAKRKMVKARRPPPGVSASKEKASSNPFAKTTLVADTKTSTTSTSTSNKEKEGVSTTDNSTKKVFGSGSGFSGFGSAAAGATASSGGGFGKASGVYKGFATAPTNTGGFGFGAAAASATPNTTTQTAEDGDTKKETTTSTAGFGSLAAAAAGGGTTKNLFDTSHLTNKSSFGGFGSMATSTSKDTEADASETKKEDGATEASPTKKSPVKLPDQVKLTTGEEEERVLLEIRCKTYKLVDTSLEETQNNSANEERKAAPSVPPSSSSAFSKSSGADAAAGSPAKDSSDDATKKDDESAIGADRSKDKQGKMRWQEIGIGPIKILAGGPNKLRLVQRQEISAHGPGSKVILNEAFWKEANLTKPGDKYVQLTLPNVDNEHATQTYSFRFKLEEETQSMYNLLDKQKSEAKSCVAKNAAEK